MVRPFRFILAAVVLPALAVFAALFSLSSVATALMPERATQLPVLNRNAFAAEAVAGLAGLGAPQESDAARRLGRAGRETFLSEPTNANAVSLLAMARQLAGDTPVARALYEDALRIDKRNRMANLWLIEDASANGRVGYILDRYDVLLRTGGPTSTALYDTLATALREPAIIPHLEARLARNPPWAEQFWLRVAPNPGAIANLGELRIRLLDRTIANPANNDDDITRRLVGVGALDIAARLVERRLGPPPADRMEIRNSRFARKPQAPPFDWETYSGAGFGGEIDPAGRALSFFAEAGVDNLVAHQLLEARPGRYALAYRVRNPGALAPLDSALRVKCANPSSPALGTLPMRGATGETTLSVPSSCRYLWVEIWARRKSPTSDYSDDVEIDSIVLRAAA